MTRTPEQIRADGLAALRRRLGRAGMIRFLQQFDPGEGDYAQQRRKWADQTTLSELRKLSQKCRSQRARAKSGS